MQSAFHPEGLDRTVYDRLLVEELQRNAVDLVCLAGYLRLLSAEFIQAFPDRIVNIHPSLVARFPGLDAQHQALAHGVKMTGCTVHFVDEQLDSGPIILQATVRFWTTTRMKLFPHAFSPRSIAFIRKPLGWCSVANITFPVAV